MEDAIRSIFAKETTSSLATGGVWHLEFGALDLWVQFQEGALYTYAVLGKEEDRDPVWREVDTLDDVAWERWVTMGGDKVTLNLRPPTRSLVVRPEREVLLLPGQSAEFFVGIPLCISIEKSGYILQNYPSVELSQTWFGSMEEGELCYAMRTMAYGKVGQLRPRLHRCICPIQVRNTSKETLRFERTCIRSGFLSIYRGGKSFWTNSVRLSYRGRNEWSRLVYSGSAPAQALEPHLVTEARREGFAGIKLAAAGIISKMKGV